MNALLAIGGSLAENNFGDTRTGGLAGPMGLFIVTMLAVGTVLLIRNMNKRLRRLPEEFAPQGTDPSQPATDAEPQSGVDKASDEHRAQS
jgi:hypothetical protein